MAVEAGANVQDFGFLEEENLEDRVEYMIKDVLSTFCRGFLVGCIGKTFLNTVTMLMMKKTKAPPTSGAFAKIKVLISLLIDFRFGMFLASYSGGFKAVTYLLQSLRKKKDSLNSICAGAVAGLSLLLAEESDRTTLALYSFIRSCEFICRAILKRFHDYLPSWLTSFKHIDTLIMCISTSQILYAYVGAQHTLSPTYLRFLFKHGAKHPAIMQVIEDRYRRNSPFRTVELSKLCALKGLPLSAMCIDGEPDICSVLHPTESCSGHFFRFLRRSYFRSLNLYIPLHLAYAAILIIVSHRFYWIKLCEGDYKEFLLVLKKLFLNIARSSAFLASYCSSAWGITCFMVNSGADKIWQMRASLLVPGLSVLWENKARRLELALYCLPRAVESFWNEWIAAGYISRPPKHSEVALFCVASAGVIYCFQQQPDAIKSNFRGMFQWLWQKPKLINNNNSNNNNNNNNNNLYVGREQK